MRRLFFWTAIVLSLLFNGCELFSDDPCGPAHSDFYTFNNGGSIDIPSWNYVSDGNRHYQWTSPFYQNVCPERHIKVEATFQLRKYEITQNHPVETRVYGDYSFFFEVDIPVKGDPELIGTSKFIDHKGDFGIKHAFSPDPGSFQVRAEVIFPTTGSTHFDSLYLMDVWAHLELKIDYKEFKM